MLAFEKAFFRTFYYSTVVERIFCLARKECIQARNLVKTISLSV